MRLFLAFSLFLVIILEASSQCLTPPSYDYTITPTASWQTTGSLSIPSGGCHIYRVYMTTTNDYDFTVCSGDGVGGTTNNDGDFTLYNSAGTQQWYIDGASGCGYDASTIGTAYAGWSPPSDGYYYLKVDDYSSLAIIYTLAYKLAAPPANPCSSVITISGCGTGNSKTYTGGGAGLWASNPCYTSPGIEQIYSFIAPTSGTYSIQVTAASGYVDYNWQATTCASSGWTCIADINATGTYGSMSWTAGTTYYILLDDENSTTGTHTFYINCPAGNPCSSVIAISGCGSGNSQTYTGGGAGSWASNPCYTSPGIEQIYSFVAPTTGTYSIQVTAASGYVDYNWQATTCASSGWTCIADISTTGMYGSMSWTAGTTYYILLDDENSTTGTHTFYINCPFAGMNVPVSGNNSYSVCSGHLYDSAGSAGDYVNDNDGYTVLNPVAIGDLVQISGTTAGESCCDYVEIFDGVGTGGTSLGIYYMGTVIPTITSPSGALTVYFYSDYSTTGAGFDITINCITPAPMAYLSSSTTQNTANTFPGAVSQQIIGIQITTTGTSSPINVSSFTFNTTGTTSVLDISNATLWATGTSGTFSTSIQLGAVVASPSGSYTITGGTNMPFTLSTGTNYFWLTYDIPAGATIGNFVDAQCTSINVAGTVYSPTPTAPAGRRPIVDLPSCSWSVCLLDLAGDGWDGNYIEVNINGVLNNTYTLASGSGPECYNININEGDDIFIEYFYSGSLAASENVYNLYDFDGNLYHEEPDPIWQGGNPPLNWAAVGAVCSTMGPCGNIQNNDFCSDPAYLYHDGGTWSSSTYYTYTDDENEYLNIPFAEIFCGSIENNSWYQFVADATTVDFNFTVFNCVVGDGIQAEVYEVSHDINGCCNGFTSVSNCWNPAAWLDPIDAGTVTATGLTVGNKYILMVDGFAGDNCDFSVDGWSATGILLPVELLNFYGKTVGLNNLVYWETSTEINNDYFILEKSMDGNNFRPVGMIKGAGNSNSSLNYSYNDENVSPGISYYRLKQVDFDGLYSYSKMISINNLTQYYSKVFPNPTTGWVEVNLGQIHENVRIEIYNGLGQLVYNENINNEALNFKLNLSIFKNGIYMLKILDSSEELLIQEKIVIHNF